MHTQKFNRAELLEIANVAFNSKSIESFGAYICESILPRLEESEIRQSWFVSFRKLAEYCCEGGKLPHAIFNLDGNSKLPFAAFSVLPVVTCPGAGDCAVWCYSLKAWRSPCAFMRQAQNTLLIKHRPELIESAFKQLRLNIDVRLYVDGDIDSIKTLDFWAKLLKYRPDLNCYSYSKSWKILLEYYKQGNSMPYNYTLNISSGGKYNDEIKEEVLKLDCVRGEFVAVKTDYKGLKGFKKYSDKQYHDAVRKVARKQMKNKKVISCGGLCGGCGNKKHWCGDKNLKDVVIAIGVH